MSAPHDRPDREELVAAVREFLERDVLDSTEGRVQFHTRVAVNALRMVERELAEGEVMAVAHEARLDLLGFADDEALGIAIREGVLDDQLDEVTSVLLEAAIDKLRVANPDYLVDDEGG